MRRAPSPTAFAADPIDRYWIGNTQIVWCRHPTACGSLHWGRPDEHDARELTQALELTDRLAPAFDVFMDGRAIVNVEFGAFALLFEYVRTRMPNWATQIRRQAVVLPNNATGAQLAGVGPMLGVTYPMNFASAVEAALAWLDWQPGDLAALAVAEVAALAAAAQAEPTIAHRLRIWLEGALQAATTEAASEALAISVRSLQRLLADAGTSFSAELAGARVRAAAAMLVETDEKIDAIARAVGCATASRLSELFRRHHGQTPAQYRASRR